MIMNTLAPYVGAEMEKDMLTPAKEKRETQ